MNTFQTNLFCYVVHDKCIMEMARDVSCKSVLDSHYFKTHHGLNDEIIINQVKKLESPLQIILLHAFCQEFGLHLCHKFPDVRTAFNLPAKPFSNFFFPQLYKDK